MNGPEILHLIRHDLQGAVARQGKPPTPRPMDASPWVAMSAMQKAIRRGHEDLAQHSAQILGERLEAAGFEPLRVHEGPQRADLAVLGAVLEGGCPAQSCLPTVSTRQVNHSSLPRNLGWCRLRLSHYSSTTKSRANRHGSSPRSEIARHFRNLCRSGERAALFAEDVNLGAAYLAKGVARGYRCRAASGNDGRRTTRR